MYMCLSTAKSLNVIGNFDHRKTGSIRRNFPVMLCLRGTENPSIGGMTVNLSQGGAFIKLDNRLPFQVCAQAVVSFFLPPDFTGQNKIIVLQGDAVITRIDQENKGMEVEFIKTFKEFERIELPDLDVKLDNRNAC